jgi:chromosome segregation and condensation protein ScpB
MKGKPSAKGQGIEMEDAIDFLRKSALVEEKSGNPTLTTRGERFLQEFQQSSSPPPSESSSPDDQSLSEETVSK